MLETSYRSCFYILMKQTIIVHLPVKVQLLDLRNLLSSSSQQNTRYSYITLHLFKIVQLSPYGRRLPVLNDYLIKE